MEAVGRKSGISIFLSYPKPCRQEQRAFVKNVSAHLENRGFTPRTLGVTDYDMDAPLKAIRRLMLESNGLITIAFGRTFVQAGITNHRSDLELVEQSVSGAWLTTPWAHIEPAMAYQIGLPVLILREAGVVADGVLEKGVIGNYMPEVDLSAPHEEYFASAEWTQIIAKWEGHVRRVVDGKGNPPPLY